ncbi:MAG: thioredoxin family protein [Gemmatimonadota bacterium]|nr:thioredoxin family protein [Gemmatimonadota bacterium]
MKITYYQSAVCPRCKMASRSIASLREEFPDIEIEKVELLTNRGRAREDGVRTIPALVSDGRKLSSFYLTRRRIREFFRTVTANTAA